MRRRDNGEGSWFRVPNEYPTRRTVKPLVTDGAYRSDTVSIPLQVNTNAKTPVLCAYFNPLTVI